MACGGGGWEARAAWYSTWCVMRDLHTWYKKVATCQYSACIFSSLSWCCKSNFIKELLLLRLLVCVIFEGVGSPSGPTVSPQVRLGQWGYSIAMTTGLALELGTWPMSSQWVSVLRLLLELLRKRSSLSLLGLLGWKDEARSLWSPSDNQEEKPVREVVAIWQKAKTSDV